MRLPAALQGRPGREARVFAAERARAKLFATRVTMYLLESNRAPSTEATTTHGAGAGAKA